MCLSVIAGRNIIIMNLGKGLIFIFINGSQLETVWSKLTEFIIMLWQILSNIMLWQRLSITFDGVRWYVADRTCSRPRSWRRPTNACSTSTPTAWWQRVNAWRCTSSGRSPGSTVAPWRKSTTNWLWLASSPAGCAWVSIDHWVGFFQANLCVVL